MIRAPRLAATRINLLAARRRLGQVTRGAVLVRRRRDALVRELFRLAEPAADVRAEIESGFALAYDALLLGLARHGRAGLRILGWPTRTVEANITAGQVWGVVISEIKDHTPVRRMIDARGVTPATAGAVTNEAAHRFELLADRLLDVASAENRLRRLSDAVSQASRHLRTLEERVAPALEAQIATLTRTLQEREREEYLRLKHLQRKQR